MVQKILQVGTSAAVTIPKDSLVALNFKVGDRVNVEVNEKHRSVVVSPLFKLDSELLDWTDKFIERYRPALEKLAKK